MKTIAVIEDDLHIGNLLEEVLVQEGYSVIRAYSGTEALLLFAQRKPDLILLDLMLPGLSGEAILPHIQGVPVIVLSAKADVSHKVRLLLDGACDYITKPFHIQELLARIAVHLRAPAAPSDCSTLLMYRNITMDTGAREVRVQNQPIHLTKTEYALLKLLLQNPKQVLTKSTMLARISEDTPDCMESSLKVHMSNLRKKLREAGDQESIEAVWGIGFKLQEP